jgi:hypothetical protein
MGTINVNDDLVKDVAAAAILNAISQADREQLISNAIKQLLVKKNTGYYREDAMSAVESAFYNAVKTQAETMIHKMVREDEELQSRIAEMIKGEIKSAVKECRLIIKFKEE